ncbi:hypothetical protein [Streptomyces hirsutus]|uniref:hypothetical protein n=1 Tax=Streptomyces hirsutus TaxID=35620 RepID=UPI0036A32466
MPALHRILTVALLLAVFAAAAAITHHRLDGTDWTDPTPHRPKPTPAAPVTVAPSPTVTITPTPTSTPGPWPLGTCLTTTLQPTPCQPGALRIVGWVRGPDQTPCADIPETDELRRTGDYALCLATD